jgi:hypothetical protein
MRTALLVATCALLSACGTTVPLAQQQTAGQDSLGTSGSGATGGSTGVVGTTGGTGGALGTATGSVTGGTTGVTAATATSGTTGTTGLAATTSGGTTGDRTPVRVGFEVIKGGNAAVTAAFGTPVNFGDGKAEITAIVNDVNAHGGVGGRRILPFIAEWNVADGNAGRDATCRSLTEDSHVTFILTVININEAFAQCAAKHHVAVINASFGSGDDNLYKAMGKYFYSPSLLSLNREESLVLDTLRAAGKASASTLVGVILDNTSDAIADRVYKTTVDPKLKAWGVPHESFSVAQQSDVSAAVLRFQSDGVKTVVFIAPSGVIEVLFMNAADNQQYRPDYGLGDSTDPWFIANAAPAQQVQHVYGAGSLPVSNVEVAQYPTTPREKACLDLIRTQGENNADRHGSLTATVYCEAVREFAFVGALASGPLTVDSFAAAYPRAGTSYPPVTTFQIDFASGRHDNAAQYRTLGYVASCTCVDYTSGLRPVPAQR